MQIATRRGSMLNRIGLTAVFTLSFAAYLLPDVAVWAQMMPLGIFAVLVSARVFASARDFNVALRSMFTADAFVFVLLLSLLMAGPCFASNFDLSPAYWLLTCAVLVLGRIYMAVTPLEEVFDGFFWSGILSVAMLLPLTFVGLMRSIQTLERFSPANFHPNFLAFLLAGYICVMAWKFNGGGRLVKLVTGTIIALSALIIFFASSRGSIIGVLTGILAVGAMSAIRARKEQGFSFARASVIAVLLVVAVLAFLRFSPWTRDIFDYLDDVLQLTQSGRAFGTGMSGRLERWHFALGVFGNGTWLTGHGLRFTDTLDPIDNSYLVMLYELGLVPAILITWRFVAVLLDFMAGYLRAMSTRDKSLYMAGVMLMTVFLVNNIVDRYLFAVGNPYSLLGFLLFAAPGHHLRAVVDHARIGAVGRLQNNSQGLTT